MDDELRQHLDVQFAALKTELSEVHKKIANFERNFATKQDLERFASKADLERVETNLLTEFHKWASPTEARLRTHAATLRAIDLEYEALSERV